MLGHWVRHPGTQASEILVRLPLQIFPPVRPEIILVVLSALAHLAMSRPASCLKVASGVRSAFSVRI